MITTKENGTQYINGLTQAVIDFHKENNFTIAFVTRRLSKDEDNEYIDDITPEEIELGKEQVRAFLYKEITDPLFFKVQRGEIDNQVWLDAIQKIKDEWK